MDSNHQLRNFYQPKARLTSIKRLETLKQMSEQLEHFDYKKALLTKLKEQYQLVAEQQACLQRHHRQIPETSDFGPLLSREATANHLAKKHNEKERTIQKYLKELEEEEEVKYVSIASRELAAQFKTFNRDKALDNALNSNGQKRAPVFKQQLVDINPTRAKLAQTEMFACSNKDLLRKFYSMFREAFANNSQLIVAALIEDLLVQEIDQLNKIEHKRQIQDAAEDFEERFSSENKNYELIYQAYKKLHSTMNS
jgi:hypothetical protein